MGMLTALEGLDDVIEEKDENGDGDFAETMLAVMEAEAEVADGAKELSELDDVTDDVDASIEQLEGIKAAIEQFGICKPMMMACDPKGELVAAGICRAYEELDDVPVKDADAETAVEAISETLKNIWKKLIAFFKMIGNKIASWWRSLMNAMQSTDKALMGAIDRMKNAEIDEAAMKATEVKAYSKADFDKLHTAVMAFTSRIGITAALNTVATLAKTIEAAGGGKIDMAKINVEVSKLKTGLGELTKSSVALGAVGLKMIKGDKYDSVEKTKATIERKSATIGKLGWSVSEIDKALRNSRLMLKAAKDVSGEMDRMVKQYEHNASVVEKESRIIDGVDEKEAASRKEAVSDLAKLMKQVSLTIRGGVAGAEHMGMSALSLSNAAIHATKKDKKKK